jgi:hypothetical protein
VLFSDLREKKHKRGEILNVKIICPHCGTVSQVDAKKLNEADEKPVLLDTPSGFEWKLPAGKITPIVGEPIYVSAIGEHLSRAQYIEKYGIDPEEALEFSRNSKNLAGKSTSANMSGRSDKKKEKRTITIKLPI